MLPGALTPFMRGPLNPFHVALAGALFLLLDARRNGLDLLPDLLGFGLLLAAALVLRSDAPRAGEARLLGASAAVAALGLAASYPTLRAATVRYDVLPALPTAGVDAALTWGSLLAAGVAQGLFLLAVRDRVQALGGNPAFERLARTAGVAAILGPLLALAVEFAAADWLAGMRLTGALGVGSVSAVTLVSAWLFWQASLAWQGPARPGPATTVAPFSLTRR